MVDVISAICKWLEIREQHGYSYPNDIIRFTTDVHHSALLQRLLSGKDPLPYPPPRSFSYPWYILIDNGIANPGEVWVPNFDMGYPSLIIDQSTWKLLETLGEDSWIVTYFFNDKIGNQIEAKDKWHVYCVGCRIPQNENISSSNKLWEIKKLDD